jgi:transposase InsO family protein
MLQQIHAHASEQSFSRGENYNRKRRHSGLGYLGPHEFEMRSTRQILCA